MIDKAIINDAVTMAIEGTDIFVVDTRVDPSNNITVELDSPGPLDVDTCARVARKIEETLDRDTEDYALEVGSAGITTPLRVRGQYLKNLGHEVEVLTRDGRKLHGVLKEVGPDTGPLAFTLSVPTKIKEPGAKRPVTRLIDETFDVTTQVKTVVPVISFR